MTYWCGTCGDARVIMRAVSSANGGVFTAVCGNGHPWVPVPGEEYVIDLERRIA